MHFDEKSMKQMPSVEIEKNDTVLASSNSKLIGIIIHENEGLIFTIDADSMIRVWQLATGEGIRSYYIQYKTFDSHNKNRKITAVCADPTFRFLAVSFEKGLVQLNNLHTGSILFNEDDPMKLGIEVSNMRFFSATNNFWMMTTCWEGQVAFFTK
jgi:WD40 repeat protein